MFFHGAFLKINHKGTKTQRAAGFIVASVDIGHSPALLDIGYFPPCGITQGGTGYWIFLVGYWIFCSKIYLWIDSVTTVLRGFLRVPASAGCLCG